MKNNKIVLPLIIILSLVFIPLSVIGVGNKIYIKARGENPDHLHKIGNKLYYYDSSNVLIGTYECKNSNCDSAKGVIDDNNFDYNLDASTDPIGVFAEDYIFVQDGDELILDNVRLDRVISTFKTYKNYGSNISGNFIILQDETGKYGLFDLINIGYANDRKYDFIGVTKDMQSAKPEDLRLAVKDNNSWYIVTYDGSVVSSEIKEPIYSYDKDFIFTSSNGLYNVYDYKNEKKYEGLKIDSFKRFNDYFIFTLQSGDIQIYTIDDDKNSVKKFKNASNGKLTYDITGDVIIVKDNSGKEIGNFSFNVKNTNE